MTPLNNITKFTERAEFESFIKEKLTENTIFKVYEISLKTIFPTDVEHSLTQSYISYSYYNATFMKEKKSFRRFNIAYQNAQRTAESLRTSHVKEIDRCVDSVRIIYAILGKEGEKEILYQKEYRLNQV